MIARIAALLALTALAPVAVAAQPCCSSVLGKYEEGFRVSRYSIEYGGVYTVDLCFKGEALYSIGVCEGCKLVTDVETASKLGAIVLYIRNMSLSSPGFWSRRIAEAEEWLNTSMSIMRCDEARNLSAKALNSTLESLEKLVELVSAPPDPYTMSWVLECSLLIGNYSSSLAELSEAYRMEADYLRETGAETLAYTAEFLAGMYERISRSYAARPESFEPKARALAERFLREQVKPMVEVAEPEVPPSTPPGRVFTIKVSITNRGDLEALVSLDKVDKPPYISLISSDVPEKIPPGATAKATLELSVSKGAPSGKADVKLHFTFKTPFGVSEPATVVASTRIREAPLVRLSVKAVKPSAMAGGVCKAIVELSNTGTADAFNVKLYVEADVEVKLTASEIPIIGAGSTEKVELELRSSRPGQYKAEVVAIYLDMEGLRYTTNKEKLEVSFYAGAQLELHSNATLKVRSGREAALDITLVNTGDRDAEGIRVLVYGGEEVNATVYPSELSTLEPGERALIRLKVAPRRGYALLEDRSLSIKIKVTYTTEGLTREVAHEVEVSVARALSPRMLAVPAVVVVAAVATLMLRARRVRKRRKGKLG
ncbi:MAG: hypothetical protein DRN96_06770 [Thermoproteota archaeon]|nr:MAG: hypothetical protein DRN96_06770 [Candidatus Korarchaeota archaeon]